MYAHIDIAHKIGIADRDALAGSLTFRITDNLHPIAHVEINRNLEGCGTHLGSFGVHQNGNAIGDGTRIIDKLVQPLKVQMRGIEADDVHPGFKELTYEIHLATLVGDGSYNLGLLQ